MVAVEMGRIEGGLDCYKGDDGLEAQNKYRHSGTVLCLPLQGIPQHHMPLAMAPTWANKQACC